MNQQQSLWNYVHKLEQLLIKTVQSQTKYRKNIKNKLKKYIDVKR
jgi:hypothetical protein